MKNRMIPRIAAFGVVFLIVAVSSAAYDFGLIVSNDSEFQYENDWTFSQSNEARLWFSTPVSSAAALFVSGLYKFEGSFTADGSSIVPYRFDLGRTELEGSFSGILGPESVFRYAIGRIAFEDASSRVVSGLADGVRTELAIGNISVYLGGGYRGLLYRKDARSLIDADDVAIYEDQDAYFAPKRAIANLGLRLNELVVAHDFGIDLWGQYDFESGGTATHTAYALPYFDGRIGRSFRWRGWCAAEFGYDTEFFPAMAAGGTLRYSVPEIIGLRLTGNLAWASGNDGNLRAFTPIRQKQIAGVASFPFSDILSASLDLSLVPLQSVNVGLGAAVLFRASDNAPSADALTDATLRPDPSGRYLGAESTARVSWRVASDFALYLSGGVFMPNTADMYTADSPLRWKSSLNATFSL